MKNPRKKIFSYYWWLIIPVAIVVFVFFRPKEAPKNTYTLQSQPMTEAVYASGNLLPKNEYKVFAMADGILAEKMVNEGDEVKLNQLLFIINNSQQNIRTQTAQDSYYLAQQNYGLNSPALRELEVGIRNAQNQLSNDSTQFVRIQNLWNSNATSKVEYDRAKLAYDNARNNHALQKARYEKAKNDLWLNLQNAQNQVRLNSEQGGDFMVRSLIDGRVFEIYKEQGEAVRRSEAIALIGSGKEVYIQLEVDELDINKIKIGQEVLVKIDVYKNQIFKAKVSKIYQMLNKQNQSFRIDAEFTTEHPTLYAGLTVEANIIIQQKNNALVIPKSFLMPGDSVWLLEGEQKKKVKIQKGIENFEWIEILSGLTNKAVIVKN
ncbi:MAG: efflux RND transporter periplasmic adaptor subunit [Cytophagales bacterium]|nr:MAG: efflux RND transporter periplasmic adaptor subunit [Cytophagales bacterium]